ncbi:AraC family transcriptional regulator [Streptomyces chiangmaiensis]|uniref:AraC family transcriptional regulator n=1 Tax=Streptomyces chiangmaiensis TaxID=766497 RepID=A0ABU7FQX2_9ACTN|nr:AraC family transcriptional regulator [Streptomyces chiangmaiensis]MED7826223.1 AraC family transcriptional regulator [Streptomyces chiangmaiensis]
MRPRQERWSLPDDTTFKCFIRREEAFDFGWHYHAEYELVLITEGSGTRYVGTTVEPYQPGNLMLLGPDLPHTFASEPYEGGMADAAVAQFRHDFLGPDFFALPQFRALAAMLERARRGLLFAAAPEPVREQLTGLPRLGDSATATVALLDVLSQLAQCTNAVPLTGPGYAPNPDHEARRRIDDVCQHLQRTHTRPVELASIAAIAHMAPTSFSRFFRRTMGRTLTDYVNQLRIETACRLLTATELPITAVGARSGYQNLSNFNRRFRCMKGMRPREYRAAHWPEAVHDHSA